MTIDEINAEIRRVAESVNLDDPASKEAARRRIRELMDERRRIYEAALAERRAARGGMRGEDRMPALR